MNILKLLLIRCGLLSISTSIHSQDGCKKRREWRVSYNSPYSHYGYPYFWAGYYPWYPGHAPYGPYYYGPRFGIQAEPFRFYY